MNILEVVLGMHFLLRRQLQVEILNPDIRVFLRSAVEQAVIEIY